MSKKLSITLYDGGQIVGVYADVEIVQWPHNGHTLMFKSKENHLSTLGKEHDKVVTHTYTTTLKSVIEETLEHSGMFSV